MALRCGAKTRAGTPCAQPAGWGTDHPGQGRCRLHGGASLRGHLHPRYKYGLYAAYEIVVTAEKARGVVGVNDVKVLFGDDGLCRGIVQTADGQALERPIPLRAQDIEVFRQLRGYQVTVEKSELQKVREFTAASRARLKTYRRRWR